ncbi:MAG: TetR/AcrR family transcriptional regulator [Anaerolineae bacterium]
MNDQTTMRRTPKQARSQQRVNQILDTAAQIFADVGYETATTNHIAERAGIPIGSLYQFFPNKESIFQALVERYLESLRSVLTIDALDSVPFAHVIDDLVESILAFDDKHIGFKVIFVQSHVETEVHEEIVMAVAAMLRQRFTTLSDERRMEIAVGGVGIVKGLMLVADYQPINTSRMMKEALVGYLREALLKENITLR